MSGWRTKWSFKGEGAFGWTARTDKNFTRGTRMSKARGGRG